MTTRYIARMVVAILLAVSTTPAYADPGDQLLKLLPDDGVAFEIFGESVAISGPIAIVGSPLGDGFVTGAAYLFKTKTGVSTATARWVQIAKLLADDGGDGDLFGASVGISRGIAIVGAAYAFSGGSAYLFDTTTGNQIAKLESNDGDQFFGTSVGISGTTAIVGTGSNSAYLFDTTTGAQIASLVPNDFDEHDGYGSAVAISGPIAIVGAPRNDDACPNDPNCNSGSAYLFDTTTGVQIAKLVADNHQGGDVFGNSVAISANGAGRGIAIVGATGAGFGGRAYLFKTNGVQIAELVAYDGAAGDGFGRSVGISGPTVIVGAIGDDDNGFNSGSAYLFKSRTGQRIAKLVPDDGAVLDAFGHSVGISRGTAVIGAPRHDDNGIESGSAYLFDAADCNVFVTDLLLLLMDFGSCGGSPADFDGDCSVGILDLLILLGNWG